MTGINAHIPLEGACNTRDLGGYSTPRGETARYAFIRCETPHGMTPADIGTLLGLGIKCVVDLRSDYELQNEPNPFASMEGVRYHNIPLFGGGAVPHLSGDAGMGSLYVFMLDSYRPAFARVFRTMLEGEGGVLFHCSAGKDRTGLIAALLLLNAGVSRQDVVSEYLLTQTLLAPWVRQQIELAAAYRKTLNPAMLEAREEYIQMAIGHLDSVYGGATEYLRAAGLSEDEIFALAGRVVFGK